jgi:hypothetical protein
MNYNEINPRMISLYFFNDQFSSDEFLMIDFQLLIYINHFLFLDLMTSNDY